MGFVLNTVVPSGLGQNRELERIRNPYCSISDVERYVHRSDLNIGFNTVADYDDMVEQVIYDAEAEIDDITKTSFHQIRRLEWHDGQGEPTKNVDFYPIIKLNKVTIYSAAYSIVVEATGDHFAVDNEVGMISFPSLYYTTASLATPGFTAVGYVYLPGKRNVAFDYWYGYDTAVPETIRFATARLAAAMLLEEAEIRQSYGLVSLNMESEGTQYGRWTAAAKALKEQATQRALRYRRVMIKGFPI